MTEMKENSRNQEWWSKYGKHVLMMMPYADEILVEGKGSWLRDADGKRILDLASGMFCAVVGHNHPKVIDRILQQTKALLHTGTQFLSPPVLEASAKLAEIAPGELSQSILLSTGTEANEFAIWAARTCTGKNFVLGFSRGYYGTSVATKSCTSLFSDNPLAAPGCARFPLSNACLLNCFRQPNSPCPAACIDDWQDMLAVELDNLAAILVEPFLSAGGMLIPPVRYMQKLKRLCEDRGALFIADEAQTCLGRTGKWFAMEHYGVTPDILVLAKAAGNGFPVSAVVVNPKISERLLRRGKFHLSSHQSDPVAGAALAAVIDVIREENLLAAAAKQGAYYVDRLQKLAEKYPVVRNVRGLGLMIGFDLVPPDPQQAYTWVHLFMLSCRKRGVHLTYTYTYPTIRLLPPLTIEQDEIDFSLHVFEESLAELMRGNVSLESLSPRNPYTARVSTKRRWSRISSRLWETSPQYWFERLRGRG